MRGRVLALQAMVFLGSTPIGGPIVGAIVRVLRPPLRHRHGWLRRRGAAAWGAIDPPRPAPDHRGPPSSRSRSPRPAVACDCAIVVAMSCRCRRSGRPTSGVWWRGRAGRTCGGASWRAAKAAHAAVVNAIVAFEPVLLVADPAPVREAAAACPEAEVVEWPHRRLVGPGHRRHRPHRRRRAAGRAEPGLQRLGREVRPLRRGRPVRPAHVRAPRPRADRRLPLRAGGRGHHRRRRRHGHHHRAVPAQPQPQPRASTGPASRPSCAGGSGVDRVVWLPYGLIEDDDTDGHVDNVALCIRPGVVLAQTTTDPDHAEPRSAARANVDVLTDAGYEVIEIDVLPEVVIDGERAVVPPLNLYLANGAAIVPVVDGPDGRRRPRRRAKRPARPRGGRRPRRGAGLRRRWRPLHHPAGATLMSDSAPALGRRAPRLRIDLMHRATSTSRRTRPARVDASSRPPFRIGAVQQRWHEDPARAPGRSGAKA